MYPIPVPVVYFGNIANVKDLVPGKLVISADHVHQATFSFYYANQLHNLL